MPRQRPADERIGVDRVDELDLRRAVPLRIGPRVRTLTPRACSQSRIVRDGMPVSAAIAVELMPRCT